MGSSEVELADIAGIKDIGLAQQYLPIRSHRERAQGTSRERIALLPGDFALDQGYCRVVGQVTQTLDVPQFKCLDGAVGDILLHGVRCTQSCQCDLTGEVIRIQVPSRGGDTDRGWRDDALQIWIRL